MQSFEVGDPGYGRNLAFVTKIAEAAHEPQARYHNFLAHPLGETLPTVTRLARVCIGRGIDASIPRLQFGSLLHDTFVLFPLVGDAYPTKEARSADFSAMVLDWLNAPDELIAGVDEDITTTARDEPWRSIPGAVLGTGDMINTAGHYETLTLPRAFDVWLEARQQGSTMSFGDLLAGCPAVFADFALKELPPELRMVPEIQLIRRNIVHTIERIKRETPESAIAKLGLTVDEVDDLVANLDKPRLYLPSVKSFLAPFADLATQSK
jgi:hypothetical protein